MVALCLAVTGSKRAGGQASRRAEGTGDCSPSRLTPLAFRTLRWAPVACARLPACPPARLPACPPARLPACPLVPICDPHHLPRVSVTYDVRKSCSCKGMAYFSSTPIPQVFLDRRASVFYLGPGSAKLATRETTLRPYWNLCSFNGLTVGPTSRQIRKLSARLLLINSSLVPR